MNSESLSVVLWLAPKCFSYGHLRKTLLRGRWSNSSVFIGFAMYLQYMDSLLLRLNLTQKETNLN